MASNKVAKFDLRSSLVNTDKAIIAAEGVAALVSAGQSYRSIANTEPARNLRTVARLMGQADGHKLIAQAESMEVIKAEYAHLAFQHAVNFDQVVAESRKKAEGAAIVQPCVVTLGVQGNVMVTEVRHDTEAAEEFRNLRTSANRGAVAECGLAFAVVFSDGFAKICRVIEPVEAVIIEPELIVADENVPLSLDEIAA